MERQNLSVNIRLHPAARIAIADTRRNNFFDVGLVDANENERIIANG